MDNTLTKSLSSRHKITLFYEIMEVDSLPDHQLRRTLLTEAKLHAGRHQVVFHSLAFALKV